MFHHDLNNFRGYPTSLMAIVYSDLLQIASDLLNIDVKIIAEAQPESSSSTKILLALDIFANTIGETLVGLNLTFSLSKENIGFNVERAKQKDVYILGIQIGDVTSVFITTNFTEQNIINPEAKIIIPKEALNHNKEYVFRFITKRLYFF